MFTSRRITTMGGDKFRDEYSLAFDGSDDYIETGSQPDYIHTNATMGMWVKMNDFSGVQKMGSHNSKRWYMGFNGTNGFIGVADESKNDITISPTPVAGQWIHYVVTAIGGTATLYINGVAQGTDSYTQASGTNPDTNWRIGVVDNSDGSTIESYMNCKISEVFQYDVGLTASQVKTLYNGREPYNHKEGIASGNLKAWYRMGDGTLDTTRHFTSAVSEGGVVSDESQSSHLGTDLADAMMTDGVWTGWGSNEVDEDSGTIKITYKSHTNSSGAYTYLKDSKGLTSDLTIGKVYKVSYQAKVGSGSVTTNISESGGFNVTGNATTSTSFVDYAIYIVCTSETDHYFYVNNMSADQEMWYQNIKVQEVVGNTGVCVNMASNQFSGDTP